MLTLALQVTAAVVAVTALLAIAGVLINRIAARADPEGTVGR
jgi:hypothetical protein